MPRFPVNFRRKSTAAEDPNGPIAEPSFRVLERPDVNSGKSFDGGVRLAAKTGNASKTSLHDMATEDNLFAGLKNNRGSGSSNTTKTASDNSSRHSNASTAPSSTDHASHDDWRNSGGRRSAPLTDHSLPPVPKSTGGFLKQAGRTFSFGSNKKNSLPPIPAEEIPPVPDYPTGIHGTRPRAETTSTVSTATPPQVEDRDFMLDLGGDLSSMLKFDKRASVATLKNMTNRASQPSPLNLDRSAPVEPPPKSWNSQHSNDGLLGPGKMYTSPPNDQSIAQPPPPPVPKHGSHSLVRRETEEEDDEDSTLLKDSVAAAQFMSAGAAASGNGSSRFRRDDQRAPSFASGASAAYSKPIRLDSQVNDENMFDKSFGRPSRVAPKIGGRSNSQPINKVMTPEEFEKYRANKDREEREGLVEPDESENEPDENYDDEEDEAEKTKQLAKQRRKQEAHMTVYRQQMMKVTGESSSNGHASRPSMSGSISTPNLPLYAAGKGPSPSPPSEGSSEDEEVPLAILAAHGFPNKNRPPTRLSGMPSQSNLRASMQPSYTAGPGSVADSSAQANGGRLPAFARKLPQDPFLGAGLINQAPRESFALGGGAPATQSRAVPTGGLVGVIANEERSRAMRRGSPAVDTGKSAFAPSMPVNGMGMNGGFDPAAAMPPQMMYPVGMQQMQPPMMTPGDQAQMHMNQQMTQFMQMQMQFMQMMAAQQGHTPGQPSPRPQGHLPTQSMGTLGDASRNSFLGGDMSRNSFLGSQMAGVMGDASRSSMNLELPRNEGRTMSMMQPSSSSWLPQPTHNGFAPSIRIQGDGYAPSIAPSERSNIGLPGRYRPVSSLNPLDQSGRTSTMSGALPQLHSKLQHGGKPSVVKVEDDDDDEEGWEAMKAKREKKRSLWRSKKNFGSDIGALIS
ncbi:hypothetical protein F5Y15DRAFT_424835 [Xylariaceae sp. FL0016]|nr:hypothetical protein F5Y15DRAFT_424835 [Xylariaceae sp. FL0016]